jgi:hypothetical protein
MLISQVTQIWEKKKETKLLSAAELSAGKEDSASKLHLKSIWNTSRDQSFKETKFSVPYFI